MECNDGTQLALRPVERRPHRGGAPAGHGQVLLAGAPDPVGISVAAGGRLATAGAALATPDKKSCVFVAL